MTDKPRVVLIDLSSLFWSAWHVHNENGVQNARTATLAGVKRCCGEGNDLVAIACDSGRSFRKELSPDYKAQREKQPEAAYGELVRTKERLAADGFTLWESPNFEADDVIATACKAALDRGHEVRIASADKDLMQLVSVRCDVLRTHTWEVWTSSTVTDKIRVDPSQLGDYLALTGDSSDNIPGCKGIGQVRAAELLTKFDTLDALYAALDAGKQVSTPANEKNLREQRAAVELSRKLVALRFDVPINFDEIYQERKTRSLTGGVDEMDTPSEEFTESKSPAPDATARAEESESSSEPPKMAESASSNGTAIVVAPAPVLVEYERQLEPTSIGTAYKLAKGLFDSRLYSRFPNPEAIMAVIIRGREMGLGALTSLDVFHIIENKPYPHAYLIVARAKADPDCEYLQCVESSKTSATWKGKSRRSPTILTCTYTVDDAKLSRLIRPGSGWEKNPEDMCVARAGAKLSRREWPAAALGLYAWQEMDGEA